MARVRVEGSKDEVLDVIDALRRTEGLVVRGVSHKYPNRSAEGIHMFVECTTPERAEKLEEVMERFGIGADELDAVVALIQPETPQLPIVQEGTSCPSDTAVRAELPQEQSRGFRHILKILMRRHPGLQARREAQHG